MGNDASQWRTHVPHYERVKYGDVYAGIDLEFYEKDRHHEYDFIVAPYADPAQIRLSFKGNDAIRLDGSGNLIIQTANGELIQYRPYTYQRVNGKKQEIASAYQLEGDEVSIQLAAYDTRKTLVMPITLMRLLVNTMPMVSYCFLLIGAAQALLVTALLTSHWTVTDVFMWQVRWMTKG